ncbi:hypothetical protein CCUS01_11884 [Colletotrichum cuscutae]|uniref:Uncharacterized protein n=1 Tax=Colletotrichum cuscutae TaxID=1209917 RepID=A0AAI9U0A9_9PEZI|nr:hypothetical protein CCUS01_11884 [Colletotrichum cuscutae]
MSTSEIPRLSATSAWFSSELCENHLHCRRNGPSQANCSCIGQHPRRRRSLVFALHAALSRREATSPGFPLHRRQALGQPVVLSHCLLTVSLTSRSLLLRG